MRIIGNAGKAREVQAVASGALSTGDTVVVNADGTVSVVAGSSGDQEIGSLVQFDSDRASYSACVYDANAQKVVIAYSDSGNAAYGTAVVGTVSGTSISFGTPVVFESGISRDFEATYDTNAQKVIIAYRDVSNSDYGTAVVGTVSGTSISFGSPVVFENAAILSVSITYDANAQKVVVAYRDFGNSSYGTAIVGAVSGTSISFGSPVVFESASSNWVSAAYDANAQKVVIAYEDGGNSDYGTAIVGTVSGTSISFGTAAVFSNNSRANNISAVYHVASQKIVIAYEDRGNFDNGTAVVGTVSGTSISFGSPVVFESAAVGYVDAVYSPTAQSVIVVYRDEGNSSYGTAASGAVSGTSISFSSPVVVSTATSNWISVAYDANAEKIVMAFENDTNVQGSSVVFQLAYSSTNLTSDNYIGTAATGAPDGKAAKINIKGAVDENQSGLTAGQSYYVQTDGTLGTTPADPSVFAGTAVAANKLIVKG